MNAVTNAVMNAVTNEARSQRQAGGTMNDSGFFRNRARIER